MFAGNAVLQGFAKQHNTSILFSMMVWPMIAAIFSVLIFRVPNRCAGIG